MTRSRLCRLSSALAVCWVFAGISRADTDSDPLTASVASALQAAATAPSDGMDGSPLLPNGSVVDSATIDASGVAHVRITLPAGSAFESLSESHAASIDALVSGAVGQVRPPAGLSIEVRVGLGSYRSLESLVDAPATAVPEPASTPDVPSPAGPRALHTGGAVESSGGPLANADGQPTGALSGVIVYCAAGHGWTAGSSSWVLQRPLLLNMVEDYGNLEQLNAFVHYLYNAGATVVPFRPVGYQPIEIVLDNDDPGVTYTGSWTNSTTATEWYENGATNSGVRYRYTTSSVTETALARYTPNIVTPGFYPVYCWTRDNTDRVKQLYRIRHSGGTAQVRIDHQLVGKGWIWLGTYYFESGTGGYVEISNQATTTSTVVADAIRFGNGMGTVVGAGPGRVSGYPREEEGQRYWAESEAGINAEGLASSIWNCCSTDSDDNVGAAARWARAMNRTNVNNDRWRRIYIEFHSNASGGAKGTVALWNDAGSDTTNQLEYATILGEKVEADMLALDDGFEYSWGARNPNTYNGSINYGAINQSNNGNEFDATILEVAFHDHPEDAANLRNAKVRDAVARSTYQAIVKFLSQSGTFPGTQVPDLYLPDPPVNVSATNDGNGNFLIAWSAGPARPSSPASGDFATSYKIYRSSNGYGFGQGVDVGNNLSATLTDIPAGETTYLRIAARNAGGESMPSETLAVRRPVAGPAPVLIVNGYDRVSRQQNPIQQIPAGPMERPIPRQVNSFDYIVQHAAAVEASGLAFDSCSNEAVSSGAVQLGGYQAVVWILGRESTQDRTFDSIEQGRVTTYLNGGGTLFASGTDLAYELDGQNAGRAFFENTLGGDYVADDAGASSVTAAGGIMTGIGSFSFDVSAGAPYRALSPDRISPRAGAVTILNYSTGGGAGIQYDSGVYRVVLLGFPFETIGSPAVRNEVMSRILNGWMLTNPQACQTARIAGFEGYASGTSVLFREPRYSGSTVGFLAAAPNLAVTSSEVPAFDGSSVCKVQWQWANVAPGNWLRLTTANAPNQPNPAIDLRRGVRLRLRLDSGSLLMCLGVRETGADVPIGSDGGTNGTIEWVGASGVVSGAPQGVLVSAQPGVWQTLTFLPRRELIQPMTGDGILSAPNNKGVLEHLAFTQVGDAGPLTVYLDNIEQPCLPQADFDMDGDVDQADFGHFQTCLSGPFTAQTDPACLNARFDTDPDVDDDDFNIFRQCMTGEGIPPDPECGT